MLGKRERLEEQKVNCLIHARLGRNQERPAGLLENSTHLYANDRLLGNFQFFEAADTIRAQSNKLDKTGANVGCGCWKRGNRPWTRKRDF